MNVSMGSCLRRTLGIQKMSQYDGAVLGENNRVPLKVTDNGIAIIVVTIL